MNTNEHEYWRKRELLPDDDAYLASVAKQVAAMRAAGEALDAITLNQRLTDTGKLAAAGGLA